MVVVNWIILLFSKVWFVFIVSWCVVVVGSFMLVLISLMVIDVVWLNRSVLFGGKVLMVVFIMLWVWLEGLSGMSVLLFWLMNSVVLF